MSKLLATRYLIATAGWAIVAALHLFSGYLDAMKYRGEYTFNAAEAAYFSLAYHSWAFFSVFFLAAIERYHHQTKPWFIGLAWLILAPIWLTTFFTIDAILNIRFLSPEKTTWLEIVQQTPNATTFFYFVMYCVTSAVCFAAYYYRSSQNALLEALELEKQNTSNLLELTAIKLEQLQSQLSPHFLFNCLGSISALARNGDREALISAVAQVGNLLRFCVSTSTEKFIFFSQELDFIHDYIALQELRYPDKFELEKSSEKGVLSVQCPPFLLHPIIENVFSHGVATATEKTQITLVAEAKGHTLKISVSNTHSLQAIQNSGLNTALANLEKRLQILYPNQYELRVEGSPALFSVTICIPIQEMDEAL
ncbi:hypothetical protein EYS14_12405 [Alteromonadaceae bacterium M269]|nr:hypothetical protein EYS14_12405 [Alteromonadaceae bacterium M269]